jgi:hypothetical protein
MTNGREIDKGGVYEVRINGALDEGWSDWFDGFAIVSQADDETVMIGAVADQPALFGILTKIRDLGLPLLSVRRVKRD